MTNNKHEGLITENVKVLTIMLQKGKQRCKTMKTYFLCWKMLLRVYDVSASYFPMFIVISCFGLAEFSASHLFRHNPPPTELLFQRPHNSRITHITGKRFFQDMLCKRMKTYLKTGRCYSEFQRPHISRITHRGKNFICNEESG